MPPKAASHQQPAQMRRRLTGALLRTLLLLILSLTPPSPTPIHAAEQARALIDFTRDIEPILQQSCLSCHGPKKQQSGLRLDHPTAALAGGELGPAIVPGKAAESRLFQAISGSLPDLQMPPKKDGTTPLTPAQIERIGTWINQGASWPDSTPAPALSARPQPTEHWAYKPVANPAPPHVRNGSRVRTPIDRFLLARLEHEGLSFSPDADRPTLLRRLHLDLTGLPPTAGEIRAFVDDTAPDAYERRVDALLASPRHGERWARHWLDGIAFGETHGFEVNTPRDNAWPYRDYVIQALNQDKPYAEFVLDQLAGDRTGQDAATGFIVAAAALLPGQIGRDTESMLLARQDELNDMVLRASSAFLGLTVHCARCHDHKFDPISQKDYFAMQAIFAGVRHGERPIKRADAAERAAELSRIQHEIAALHDAIGRFSPLSSSGASRPPVHASMNVDRFAPVTATALRFTVHAASSLEPCLDELEVFAAGPANTNIALASAGSRARASSTLPNSDIHRLEHINDGRFGNSRSWISNEPGKGWVEIEFPAATTIDRVHWSRDREQRFTDRLATNYLVEARLPDGSYRPVAGSTDRAPFIAGAPPVPASHSLAEPERQQLDRLLQRQASLRDRARALAAARTVYAGRFEDTPAPTRRLHRGDPMQAREEVPPTVLSRIGPQPPAAQGPATESERRLLLAGWIASPDHPLSSRVLVNRLWHFHFGEGIVNTPSDFGMNGARPTHPELLDWLARRFQEEGGSLKRLHRWICLSTAYRQASRPRPEAARVDAGNRLLWRYPTRRAEAEVLRDSMLAAAGVLDLRMGGPGFSVFKPNDNYVRVYEPRDDFGPGEWRRMVYATKVRMAQDGTFGAFDCPDAGQAQPKRPRSTTPIQALNLFNSPFTLQLADRMAQHLRNVAPPNAPPEQLVRDAFLGTLGREPAPAETATCTQLVRDHGIESLCRVLFNSNEFLFIP